MSLHRIHRTREAQLAPQLAAQLGANLTEWQRTIPGQLPPQPGVWNASVSKGDTAWRVWDGQRWSQAGTNIREALAVASRPCSYPSREIMWRGLDREVKL